MAVLLQTFVPESCQLIFPDRVIPHDKSLLDLGLHPALLDVIEHNNAHLGPRLLPAPFRTHQLSSRIAHPATDCCFWKRHFWNSLASISGGGRARGRLFPGLLGPPGASSAAGRRAAFSCARELARAQRMASAFSRGFFWTPFFFRAALARQPRRSRQINRRTHSLET